MVNNYSGIIPNPYKNLSTAQIELYYFLLGFNPHEGFSVSNESLSKIHGYTVTSVSRNLKQLHKAGFIDLKYIPNKNGTIRIISVKDKNEN